VPGGDERDPEGDRTRSTGYLIGIDGGGTRTTIGFADVEGRELGRHVGGAGLVDPRRPEETVGRLVALVGDGVRALGLGERAAALCAGLAGVGPTSIREAVERQLSSAGIAGKALVISDGEAALMGAFGGGAGILVVSGTGSVAFGRGENGRVERCGGWGMVVGDEGSGYELARAALRAVLHSVDGRAVETRLLSILQDALGAASPDDIPALVGRAEKAAVAALAPLVLRAAEDGDALARELLAEAALDLAAHTDALANRLGPWSRPPDVVLHGGVATHPYFSSHLTRVLGRPPWPLRVVAPLGDAVSGALECARRMA
jgi:glucosamine kinase